MRLRLLRLTAVTLFLVVGAWLASFVATAKDGRHPVEPLIGASLFFALAWFSARQRA